MKLENYLSGRWQVGTAKGRPLVNPVTGEEIARADATGLNVPDALAFARTQGGAAMSSLGFAERGAILASIAATLQANRDTYFETARMNSGNTATDASVDIDGAIFTLKTYARIGKQLGDAKLIIEPGQDQLARDPIFFSRHLWTTRPGVAVQINAFNFPAWGMWEKVAQATLAGVPSFVKPATATSLLSEQMMRDVIDADVAPKGMLSLLCGSAEGILETLGAMDSVSFTGSASTAMILRAQIASMEAAPRLTIEADSVNATILGIDVTVGSDLFNLALREATKALSVKAGQFCTNIRRILVPTSIADDFANALQTKVEKLVVGDPADEATRVGPLINAAQHDDAHANIAKLMTETDLIAQATLPDCAAGSGFVAPTLLRCSDVPSAKVLHQIEVFGPCATLLPYNTTTEAVSLAQKAEGSLVASVFSADASIQAQALTELGPWHGRLLMVDTEVGKAHTGQTTVMPQCVHGGPGRAGGGEELGGLRGLRFHMQRSALQAGPAALNTLAARACEATL